jgi:hypothetical protein
MSTHDTTLASVHRIPRQRGRVELERAALAVEDWLDTQAGDDDIDVDADCLRRISELAIADAPESAVAQAVDQAREAGWGFAPIAMLLGLTPRDARKRYGCAT